MPHGTVQKWRAAPVALACAVLVGLLGGCGDAGDETAGSSSGKPTGLPTAIVPAGGTGSGTGSGDSGPDAVARYAKWDLVPFAAAPIPPQDKPVAGGGARPPVIDRVPTSEKIVFITIDDGAEKDPEFLEMMRDLRIPVSMFLNDTYVREDPEYFRVLQGLGASVQNHSLSHPDLKTLGVSAQKHQICGQQDRLAEEFGTPPTLFRPPYGNWNETTRTIAGGCGVKAIVKWRESMQINDMQYVGAKKLHPGDIILSHFRGPAELKGTTMTTMFGNMLRKIQAQGYTIARLEDYIA